MFQTKVVGKTKHNFMFIHFFFRKCLLLHNVEKYDKTGEATDGIVTRRMRFEWPIIKATDTHSEYVILIDFPW
jgi:hypothetical protein